MSTAVDFLLQSQNADGGWGYRVRGISFAEPTAVAMMALKNDDDARIPLAPPARAGVSQAEGRARDFLLSIQHADGGWGIAAMDVESGWMTAWAVLALAQLPDARDAVARGAQWLIETEGLRVIDAPSRGVIFQRLQIDSTLRGWPWQPGDAAWVHPTALAMLALYAAGKSSDARIVDGVAYLFDRVVASGGWNIGNPEMLDKSVPATIQDTALALRALHAAREGAGDARIVKAIQFLRDSITRARTAAELAWGIYALRDWSIDVGDAVARLDALQSGGGGWMGNPFITAIAVLASQESG